MVISSGFPMVDGIGLARVYQKLDPLDQVVHITDAPRLAPVPEHRDVFATERLRQERRMARHR